MKEKIFAVFLIVMILTTIAIQTFKGEAQSEIVLKPNG